MRICPGTLITILYQARAVQSHKYKNICKGIFAAYGLEIDNYSNTLSSHIRSGSEKPPSALIDAAREMSAEDVTEGFRVHVLTHIADSKRKAVIRAIRAVLREDNIERTTCIGYDGYNKDTILTHDSFSEASILASVFRYAFVCTDNTKMKNSIKEIPKDFVDRLINSNEEINLIHPLIEQDDFVPLQRTLKSPMFDRIFKYQTSLAVSGLTNPSSANIYYIDPMNCKFRFQHMKEFLLDNIGNYVFSRSTMERIMDRTKDRSSIGAQAVIRFMAKFGQNAESILGEVLLYVFLEQVLNAPKILTKLEIDDQSGVISKSDGIHLLTHTDSGQLFHQLVFGAADINGDLINAVDRAFEKITKIESNYDTELRLVYNTTQQAIYGKEATKFMVELMTPQRDRNYIPDLAFGAFLGYTIKLEKPETDNIKYRAALKEQLQKDIAKAEAYIAQKIRDNGMSGYSFYFYVLPFNDADSEKITIIQEMLTGGF